MNLLGIEMLMLIIGIALIVYMILNIIGTCLEIVACIKREDTWEYNIAIHFIMIMIGIILIIISQNI